MTDAQTPDAPTPPPQPDARPAGPRAAEPLWRDLLGAQLREARQDRAETLQQVARRANVSTQYLSEVERGRKEASSEVVAALAGALGLTLLDLAAGAAARLGAADARTRGAFRLAA